MVDRNIQNKIVEETDIVEVVSEYVKLVKKGTSYFGLCPFHDDKNPSMSVSNKVKLFNCFSCGAKGNVITFVSRIENISIDQACAKLGKRLGINVSLQNDPNSAKKTRLKNVMKEADKFYRFYLKNSQTATNALEYLKRRGMNEDIIEYFGVGLAPNEKNQLNIVLNKKNISELDQVELGLISSGDQAHDIFRDRIIFPLADSYGDTVGFSGRIYNDSKMAKYINSSDNILFHKGNVLYNLNRAMNEIRKLNKVYLFEGFMDVIACYKADILNGVATMGTALTQTHIKELLSLTKNIVLCFDGDAAGIKAMIRSSALLANFNIIPNAIVIPDNLDPDEYFNKYGKDKLRKYFEEAEKPVHYWLYQVNYRNFVPGDIQSKEQLKHNVFDFLRYTKEQTIIDHYLSKLATDASLDLEGLKTDFLKIKKVTFNSETTTDALIPNTVISAPQTSNVVLNTKVKEVIETDIKKSVVLKKHIIAFNGLIKFVYDNKKYHKEFSEINFPYASELKNQFTIANLMIDTNFNKDVYLNEINNNESLKATFDQIVNFSYIDTNNEVIFKDFVKCLCNLNRDFVYQNKLTAAKSGQKEKIDEFIEIAKRIKIK